VVVFPIIKTCYFYNQNQTNPTKTLKGLFWPVLKPESQQVDYPQEFGNHVDVGPIAVTKVWQQTNKSLCSNHDKDLHAGGFSCVLRKEINEF
jgi:hypothetical protein